MGKLLMSMVLLVSRLTGPSHRGGCSGLASDHLPT
jgi:hypothetical protein